MSESVGMSARIDPEIAGLSQKVAHLCLDMTNELSQAKLSLFALHRHFDTSSGEVIVWDVHDLGLSAKPSTFCSQEHEPVAWKVSEKGIIDVYEYATKELLKTLGALESIHNSFSTAQTVLRQLRDMGCHQEFGVTVVPRYFMSANAGVQFPLVETSDSDETVLHAQPPSSAELPKSLFAFDQDYSGVTCAVGCVSCKPRDNDDPGRNDPVDAVPTTWH